MFLVKQEAKWSSGESKTRERRGWKFEERVFEKYSGEFCLNFYEMEDKFFIQ